jgi:hypothetical protein
MVKSYPKGGQVSMPKLVKSWSEVGQKMDRRDFVAITDCRLKD